LQLQSLFTVHDFIKEGSSIECQVLQEKSMVGTPPCFYLSAPKFVFRYC
jgi:hypothetical protein